MRFAARHQRWVFVILFAIGFVLLLQSLAWAASDVFQNTGPEPQVVNGLADKWPLGNYALDTHVDGFQTSLTGGVNTDDLPAAIAGFLAGIVWKLTAFLASTVITVLTFAFSLDLINGSDATAGVGALGPISDATRNIYDHTFGEDWMVVGVLLAAFWAMWRSLVQRRHAEVAGALGLSLLFSVIALSFILRPDATVGEASKWVNRMSESVLSISQTGDPSSKPAAKRSASDQLFKLLVFDPWVVLNFGGVEHCVKPVSKEDAEQIAKANALLGPGTVGPESVPVNPLAADAHRDAQLRRQLANGTQVSGDGKTCINNANKYAAHFLRWSPSDKKRSNDDKSENSAYTALRAGDADKLPDADPEKSRTDFGPEDTPAVDQMQAGGQFNRLVMALFIFGGAFGAFLVLAAMSFGVMLAALIVLFLLVFTPVVAVLAILPGRGHLLFKSWGLQLLSFLLRKFVYSLVIAVLLAVGAALSIASANMGWFMAYLLQGAFFWSIFLYRKELVAKVNGVIAGAPGGGGDVLRRLQGTYYSGMMLRRPLGAIGGAVVGAAAAPVTIPLAIGAARAAKRKQAERAANESRRAANERQDLADRITSSLRPPQDDSQGPAPGADGDVPTPRASGPVLPLVRRYTTGRRGAGDDSVTTGGPSNGRPDDDGPDASRGGPGRPKDPDAPVPPGGIPVGRSPSRGPDAPSRPGDRPSRPGGPDPTSRPGDPDAPSRPGDRARPTGPRPDAPSHGRDGASSDPDGVPPPPSRPPARDSGGRRPPDRSQPVSLTDSLADDAARMREVRERRDAAEGKDQARRGTPPPPRTSQPPKPPRTRQPPPRRPDDEGRR